MSDPMSVFLDAISRKDTPFLSHVRRYTRPIIGWTEPVNARKQRFWQRVARLAVFRPFADVTDVIAQAQDGEDIGVDLAPWITGPVYEIAAFPLRLRRHAERQAIAYGPQPIYDPDWQEPEWPQRMEWGMAEREEKQR